PSGAGSLLLRQVSGGPDHKMSGTLTRRAVSELIGTALLLATIVGSGIMAERLARGNLAIALFANSSAAGSGRTALILTFGSISGAHFNPLVTLNTGLNHDVAWLDALLYITAQALGAVIGTIAANLMFGGPPITLSHRARTGLPQFFSEVLASFGL